MKRSAAAALFLAALVLCPGAEEVRDRVKALAEGLASEDVEVREAASRDLAALGEPAREAMQAELDASTDLEVRARLTRLLRALDVPAWRDSLAPALAAAAPRRKPVLVVEVGPGEAGGWGMLARVTFEREAVSAALQGWEAVWIGASRPGTEDKRLDQIRESLDVGGVQYEGQQGLRDIRIWVLTHDGKIRHFLQGWWGEDRLVVELERAKAMVAASEDALATQRVEIMETLKKEFEGSTCANVRRHLGPWNCQMPGCAIRRLMLSYDAGGRLLGTDVTTGFPEPWQESQGPERPKRR